MNIELKDYFAGQVLQALIVQKTGLPSVDYLVTMSYAIAEKMVEQKNKLLNDKYINSSKQINTNEKK